MGSPFLSNTVAENEFDSILMWQRELTKTPFVRASTAFQPNRMFAGLRLTCRQSQQRSLCPRLISTPPGQGGLLMQISKHAATKPGQGYLRQPLLHLPRSNAPLINTFKSGVKGRLEAPGQICPACAICGGDYQHLPAQRLPPAASTRHQAK